MLELDVDLKKHDDLLGGKKDKQTSNQTSRRSKRTVSKKVKEDQDDQDDQNEQEDQSESSTATSDLEEEEEARPSKLAKFGRALKQTFYLGTWSNVLVPVVATLIIVFISLLALRPPMVMVEKKSKDPNQKPEMVLSGGLALVWAIIAAIIVFVITFFSRPKPQTSYSQVL
jgi:hypothetical protein